MINLKDVQTSKVGRTRSFQLPKNMLDGDKFVSANNLAKSPVSPGKADNESDKGFKFISKTDLRSINERYFIV